jgi:hypothetical protein
MSLEAELAVENLTEKLTPDEYRLLTVIAKSGALAHGCVWPDWGHVLEKTHLTEVQAGRLLRGLSNEGYISFGGTDIFSWITVNDPRLPITLNKTLCVWIAGMPSDRESPT